MLKGRKRVVERSNREGGGVGEKEKEKGKGGGRGMVTHRPLIT